MTDLPTSGDTAYVNAPHAQMEIEALLRLRPAVRISDRDWLLRHAALIDRQSLDADPADGKAQTSVRVSITKLLAFNAANGTTTGPPRPRRPALDDPAWTADPRGYVRQEYAIWANRDLRQ
ncbi:hypothetical protein [Streptomyces virginiae]